MNSPNQNNNQTPTVIKVNKQGSIYEITIHRPDKLNAINQDVQKCLSLEIDNAEMDEEIKVVILSGAGDKAFSAGADISELDRYTNPLERFEIAHPSEIIDRLRKPIIAMIRGYALGGGLELALACDFRIASSDAKFGLPEITHGWIPGAAGTALLSKYIGVGRAMKIVLTGIQIGAKEAKEIGLVEEIFPPNRLKEETWKMALAISERSLESLKLAKEAIKASVNIGSSISMKYSKSLSSMCWASEKVHTGVRNFKKKRHSSK